MFSNRVIFTEGEGDGIETRLPFKILSNLHQIFVFESETSNLDYLLVFIFILGNCAKFELN